MRRVVQVGRGAIRPTTLGQRRTAVYESLVASGEVSQLQTNFMFDGSLASRKFYELTLSSGYVEMAGDSWPCDKAGLGDLPDVVFRDGDDVVLVLPGGALAKISLGYGWFSIRVASATAEQAASTCSAFRQAYPASYLMEPEGGEVRVPITFWTNSPFGPQPRLRKIDSATWGDITGNYTAPVRDELASLMTWDDGPTADGQLLLWQGPPGTGKTWALRALATEWARWAEFHYITDPDSFFVGDPSYMINVLLSDSYSVVDEPTGDIYNEADPLGKWRVLILEDTGELLAANAKESYGQGLSRLLNVVDGMIGQGLRVLALVTTNDELGDLHPAVSRPGRCASQIEFGPLTPAEASAWLGEETDEGGTVAELYSRQGAGVAPALDEDGEVVVASAEIGYERLLELARRPLDIGDLT